MTEQRTYGPGWSLAYPWDELDEQQRTHRLDEVLDYAGSFVYMAPTDTYRKRGADPKSADWCPASDVEERRKWRDMCEGSSF